MQISICYIFNGLFENFTGVQYIGKESLSAFWIEGEKDR